MTKLGEEFLLNFINLKPIFRLPIVSCEENCFLMNDGRNSVVKVHDRKLLHSWTLKYPHSFTCPVVYDCEDESIYCVSDSNIVLKWSKEDDTLKNATKFKFQESIFSTIYVDGHKPIVLFVSGKILLISESEPVGEGFINEDEKIIWADAEKGYAGVNIACLKHNKKDNSHELITFTVTENTVSNHHMHSIEHGPDVLKNWCLNKHSHSFLTVWSSGIIQNYQLETQEQSILLSLSDQVLAIDCIDSNHIALVKSKLKSKESCLEIWDTKFTALKARKVLKSLSSSVQLSVIGTVLFLSHNEELMEVSFSVEKSTLAAVVGKSLTTTPKLQEFSWNNGKLQQLSNPESSMEKMDTSEVEQDNINATELIAERLMEEGSVCLNYIPESQLVRLLRLAIRCKFKQNDKNSKINPDVILNAIFSASFSDVFLVKFMKKLSLEDTMVTLEILISELNNKRSSPFVCQDKPSDFQLFNWICLVIQSHMETLLLSKNKKTAKLLRKLDKCLSEKMQEYEDYESIQHLFLILQKKNNILPEKRAVGKYCIETLDT